MSYLVAYDHSIFSIQEQGGISRYYIELAEHLSTEPDCKTHIVAPVHVCRILKQHPQLSQTGLYIPKIKNTYRLLQAINNSLSGPLINRLQPDIVHSTYYLARYKLSGSCKRVITVFDMIHEKYADGMDSFEKTLPVIKKNVVEKADHVICISEQTRSDVVEILGIDEEKTSVIHLASSFSSPESKTPAVIDTPYLFYVGSREWPKNFRQFVKAFASFKTLNPDVILVCFGGGRFTKEEVDYFHSLHLGKEQVHFISGDDNLLGRLYSNALALVYPSLYEGFGLPVLEAMACGCPVICSNTSSMPEVAGDAAMYFAPTVIDEMAESMNQVIQSSEIRTNLISKGYERVRQFSWEKCARETAQVYRSCLQDNK